MRPFLLPSLFAFVASLPFAALVHADEPARQCEGVDCLGIIQQMEVKLPMRIFGGTVVDYTKSHLVNIILQALIGVLTAKLL